MHRIQFLTQAIVEKTVDSLKEVPGNLDLIHALLQISIVGSSINWYRIKIVSITK